MKLSRDSLAPLFVAAKGTVVSYLSPYYQAPSLHTHWKQYVRDGIIAALLIVGLIAVFHANSATYTFIQTNWSGGATVTNANHGANRTGWNQYSAKDPTTALINGSADVQISSTAGSSTQTTNTDFSAGSFSNVVVNGSGVGAGVMLTASTPAPAWTPLASAPGNIGEGGSNVYLGSGDYIYQLKGGPSNVFLRYSISGDSWATLASTPGTIGDGGSLVYPGSGDYIYTYQGGNNTAFYRYSISGNSWTTMAPAPGSTVRGSALVYPGSGDYIYGLAGNGTNFYRYSISGNSWTTMAAAPAVVYSGGALVYPGSGDYIYATRGGNPATKDFWRYSISGNSWTAMASSTFSNNVGASLVYPGSGDYIYDSTGQGLAQRYSISQNTWSALTPLTSSFTWGSTWVHAGGYLYIPNGNGTANFYRYSIADSVPGTGWTSMTSTPATIAQGGSLAYTSTGNYIYGLRGGYASQSFYRYSVTNDSWSTMANIPVAGETGAAIVYPSSGDYIYAVSGFSKTAFNRYSISGNSWTAMSDVPAIVNYGAALVYPGSGDFIYAQRGNSSKDFYRYSISGNSWTAMASTTVNVSSGGTLVYPGSGDYIYSGSGNNNTFYRYSISGNSWTALSNLPTNVSSGSALAYPGSGDYIYGFRGNATADFYRYSISGNSWVYMPSAPAQVTDGGSLVYTGSSYLYGMTANSTTNFYRFAVLSFASSGTFTSSVMDTGNYSAFTTLSFTASTPTSTGLSIDVRAGNTPTPDGSWTSWQIGVANGGDISVLAGNRYVQYRANLTSSDVTVTPTLSDVTFNYTQYASSTTLTSSAYDSSSPGNVMAKIAWSATTPPGTAVKFQVRSAPDASGTPGTWSGWMGPDGTVGTYFTASDGSDTMPATLKDATDDQWFQYQAFLTTTTSDTPTLSDVTVTYVVNAPPEFDTSFGTQGSTASQVATSTDPNWGKVEISYKVRDPDSTTGSITPGFITPSFEYDIGGGWVAITAGNLAMGAVTNKAVTEGTYTLYTTYFDVTALIPDTYTTSARIRVKANDNEGANNLAYAVTPTFTLDTKAPIISSMHVDGTSATGTVTFSATDDTTILSYTMSNNTDYSADGSNSGSGVAQSVGNSSATIASAWTLVSSSTKTVYLKLTDAQGNIATCSVVVPATPSNIEYKDISSIDTNIYREFVAWNLYPDPAPAGAPFGSYELYRSTDGNNYSLIYTSTNPTINYYLDTAVSTTTNYFYKVAFTTSNGDRTLFSRVVSDTPDGKGGSNNGAIPIISAVSVTDVKNTSAKVTWTTDDLALSEVDFGTTNSYGQVATSRSYVTGHVVYLTGLTPNTTYYFRVRSIDAYSGTATDNNAGSGYTFTTGGGTIISGVTTSAISDTGADIVWNTSTLADSYVSYSTDPTLLTYTDAGSDSLTDSHKVTLSGLTTDTLYYYKVTSKDADANTTVDDNNGSYHSFRTTHDTKVPTISDVAVPVKASDGAVITWKTDELATSQVEYGTSPMASTTNYLYTTAPIMTPSIFHSVTLSQETTRLGGDTNKLTKKTTYYFRVKSADTAGNYVYSDEGSFTTTEDGAVNILGGGYSNDTNPASAVKPTISTVDVSDVGPFGATVSFSTNINTRAIVQYGDTTEYAFSAGDASLSQNHKVILKGLKMGSSYHVSASAVDKYGNVVTSPDQTFKTTNLAEDLGKLSTLSDNIDQLQQKLENIIESALPSINPPFIEKPQVDDIGEDFARITWRTNVKAYGSVNYAEDADFSKNSQYVSEQANTSDKVIDHSINLTNLRPNTKYHLKVKSYVFSGADGTSDDITFVTKAGQVQAQVRERKKDSMHIVWTTTIPTTSVVIYKIRGSQVANRRTDDGMTTSHDILLDNLKPATTYEIRAYGLTAEGNTVEARDTVIASTNEDSTPPAITNFKVDSALIPGRTDRTQTIVSWKTDEPATSVVYYEEGSGSAESKLSQTKDNGLTYTDTHVVILTNLKPGTIYRFQIISVDDAGNMTKLPIRTIVTPSQSESIVDVIFKNFDDTFKFMRSVR